MQSEQSVITHKRALQIVE